MCRMPLHRRQQEPSTAQAKPRDLKLNDASVLNKKSENAICFTKRLAPNGFTAAHEPIDEQTKLLVRHALLPCTARSPPDTRNRANFWLHQLPS
jgi:hypothetical protein